MFFVKNVFKRCSRLFQMAFILSLGPIALLIIGVLDVWAASRSQPSTPSKGDSAGEGKPEQRKKGSPRSRRQTPKGSAGRKVGTSSVIEGFAYNISDSPVKPDTTRIQSSESSSVQSEKPKGVTFLDDVSPSTLDEKKYSIRAKGVRRHGTLGDGRNRIWMAKPSSRVWTERVAEKKALAETKLEMETVEEIERMREEVKEESQLSRCDSI